MHLDEAGAELGVEYPVVDQEQRRPHRPLLPSGYSIHVKIFDALKLCSYGSILGAILLWVGIP